MQKNAMQKKKRLGDKSLNWIKDTKKSSPMTSVSKKEVKSKSKAKRLGVLKQYVSEKADVKKIKPEKADVKKIKFEKALHPIPDKSVTIYKRKKKVTHKEKEIKEKIEVARNEKVEEKKITAPEKVKFKTGEIIETAKKEVTKVTDTITKPFGFIKRLSIKKGLNSVISVSTHPIRTVSSIDRKITMSVKKISLPDNENMIDNNIVKPIKNVDDSVSRVVKKFLDSIL